MPIELDTRSDGEALEVRVRGEVSLDEYRRYSGKAKDLIGEHGAIRVLLVMDGFEGLADDAWPAFKDDAEAYDDFSHVAFVGETLWQHALVEAAKPFTSARLRWFDREDLDRARSWIDRPDD